MTLFIVATTGSLRGGAGRRSDVHGRVVCIYLHIYEAKNLATGVGFIKRTFSVAGNK